MTRTTWSWCPAEARFLSGGDGLEGETLLPGFRCPGARIFEG
ncbi:MAG: hypothetical protein WEG36_07580 [Gemmatimonadota bacterium]